MPPKARRATAAAQTAARSPPAAVPHSIAHAATCLLHGLHNPGIDEKDSSYTRRKVAVQALNDLQSYHAKRKTSGAQGCGRSLLYLAASTDRRTTSGLLALFALALRKSSSNGSMATGSSPTSAANSAPMSSAAVPAGMFESSLNLTDEEFISARRLLAKDVALLCGLPDPQPTSDNPSPPPSTPLPLETLEPILRALLTADTLPCYSRLISASYQELQQAPAGPSSRVVRDAFDLLQELGELLMGLTLAVKRYSFSPPLPRLPASGTTVAMSPISSNTAVQGTECRAAPSGQEARGSSTGGGACNMSSISGGSGSGGSFAASSSVVQLFHSQLQNSNLLEHVTRLLLHAATHAGSSSSAAGGPPTPQRQQAQQLLQLRQGQLRQAVSLMRGLATLLEVLPVGAEALSPLPPPLVPPSSLPKAATCDSGPRLNNGLPNTLPYTASADALSYTLPHSLPFSAASGPCVQWLLLSHTVQLCAAAEEGHGERDGDGGGKLYGIPADALQLPLWGEDHQSGSCSGLVQVRVPPPPPRPPASSSPTAEGGQGGQQRTQEEPAKGEASGGSRQSKRKGGGGANAAGAPGAQPPLAVSPELVLCALRLWRVPLGLERAAAHQQLPDHHPWHLSSVPSADPQRLPQLQPRMLKPHMLHRMCMRLARLGERQWCALAAPAGEAAAAAAPAAAAAGQLRGGKAARAACTQQQASQVRLADAPLVELVVEALRTSRQVLRPYWDVRQPCSSAPVSATSAASTSAPSAPPSTPSAAASAAMSQREQQHPSDAMRWRVGEWWTVLCAQLRGLATAASCSSSSSSVSYVDSATSLLALVRLESGSSSGSSSWRGKAHGSGGAVGGAGLLCIPPAPSSLDVSAALSAGLPDAVEALLRSTARLLPREPRFLVAALGPLLGNPTLCRQTLAFADPHQVAALMVTTAKVLRVLAAKWRTAGAKTDVGRTKDEKQQASAAGGSSSSSGDGKVVPDWLRHAWEGLAAVGPLLAMGAGEAWLEGDAYDVSWTYGGKKADVFGAAIEGGGNSNVKPVTAAAVRSSSEGQRSRDGGEAHEICSSGGGGGGDGRATDVMSCSSSNPAHSSDNRSSSSGSEVAAADTGPEPNDEHARSSGHASGNPSCQDPPQPESSTAITSQDDASGSPAVVTHGSVPAHGSMAAATRAALPHVTQMMQLLAFAAVHLLPDALKAANALFECNPDAINVLPPAQRCLEFLSAGVGMVADNGVMPLLAEPGARRDGDDGGGGGGAVAAEGRGRAAGGVEGGLRGEAAAGADEPAAETADGSGVAAVAAMASAEWRRVLVCMDSLDLAFRHIEVPRISQLDDQMLLDFVNEHGLQALEDQWARKIGKPDRQGGRRRNLLVIRVFSSQVENAEACNGGSCSAKETVERLIACKEGTEPDWPYGRPPWEDVCTRLEALIADLRVCLSEASSSGSRGPPAGGSGSAAAAAAIPEPPPAASSPPPSQSPTTKQPGPLDPSNSNGDSNDGGIDSGGDDASMQPELLMRPDGTLVLPAPSTLRWLLSPCSNPGCINCSGNSEAVLMAGGGSEACGGGCGAVRYCSTVCRNAHWAS
ncbi:hypothetical protein Agub_g8201, partial [Astrephomene gubernaculifera]